MKSRSSLSIRSGQLVHWVVLFFLLFSVSGCELPFNIPANPDKDLSVQDLPLVTSEENPIVQDLPLGDVTKWYVSTSGADANECHTPATACRNIQTAIDRAAGGDTINIGAGKFEECLIVRKSLSFYGQGIDVTILDGDKGDFGVFWLDGESPPASELQITMTGLTIQNGITNVNNYERPRDGGGINAVNTNLTIDSVRFYNNLAPLGGAIYFSHLFGGPPSNSLVVTNSVFFNNIAHEDGGAIYIIGNLRMENVVLDHNSGSQGASIYSEGVAQFKNIELKNGFAAGSQIYNFPPYNTGILDDFMIENSRFENNEGGVLWIRKGRIANTSFSSNQGNVIYADLSSEELIIMNSTISGNLPYFDLSVAGIWMTGSGGKLTLMNVTIAENQIPAYMQVNPTPVSITNTLFANNAPNCTAFSGPLDFSSFISGSNNIATDDTCGSSFVVVPDALIGPLANNGSGTLTHALLPGSPAIDNGREWKGLNTDQRGLPRMQDGNGDGIAANDIGAFEAPKSAFVATNTPMPIMDMNFIPERMVPCRQGPAFLYAAVGMVTPGVNYPLMGISTDSNWYQVEFYPAVKCWVRADTGKPSGDTLLLPVIPVIIITVTITPTLTPTIVSSAFDCTTVTDDDWCVEKYGAICSWEQLPSGAYGCINK
jgi:hypothetical protein